MVSNIFRCETCKDTTCWLCEGNVYYDRVMKSKSEDAKPHKYDIVLFRDFIKLKGCASHSDFKNQRKEIFDNICDKLDKYYYSLPKDSPYLDGIDISIQEIEKLYDEGEDHDIKI